MRRLFVLFGAFLLVAATKYHKPKPCKVDPLKSHPICAFYPPNCLPPICAKGPDGKTTWFGNSCCLDYYNNHCKSKYTKVNDIECNSNNRPKYEVKPCSIKKDNLGNKPFADVWDIIQTMVKRL